MGKTEIVKELQIRCEMTKTKATDAYDSFVASIINGLKTEGRVAVGGLGTFKRVTRAPRNGVNPKTGEKIVIPEREAITFKAGKGAK